MGAVKLFDTGKPERLRQRSWRVDGHAMNRTPVQSAEMRSIAGDQRNEPRLSAGLRIWPHQRRRVGAERTERKAAPAKRPG